jgi:hypothetical protein
MHGHGKNKMPSASSEGTNILPSRPLRKLPSDDGFLNNEFANCTSETVKS